MKSENADKLFNEAIDLRDKDNLAEALTILSKIVETPPAIDVLRVKGKIHWDLRQLPEAISCFRNATRYYPDDEIASLALFHTLSNNGQDNEATEEMERFLSIASSEEYESFRADYYFKRGMNSEKDDMRISLLERATQADPKHAEAFMELGISYRKRGEVEKARSALNSSINLNDDGWARLYLGNLFFFLREWDAAEKEFLKAQILLPHVSAPLWCQADVHQKKGNLIKSEQLHREALKLEPESEYELARVGRFFLESNKRSEGTKYIQMALQKNPDCNMALRVKQEFNLNN